MAGFYKVVGRWKLHADMPSSLSGPTSLSKGLQAQKKKEMHVYERVVSCGRRYEHYKARGDTYQFGSVKVVPYDQLLEPRRFQRKQEQGLPRHNWRGFRTFSNTVNTVKYYQKTVANL